MNTVAAIAGEERSREREGGRRMRRYECYCAGAASWEM
jgi:hypothetical protein